MIVVHLELKLMPFAAFFGGFINSPIEDRGSDISMKSEWLIKWWEQCSEIASITCFHPYQPFLMLCFSV